MVVWCTQDLRRDGCSFMWHQPCQRCKYTTSVDIQKTRYKASHSCRTTCERSESAQESGEWHCISDHQSINQLALAACERAPYVSRVFGAELKPVLPFFFVPPLSFPRGQFFSFFFSFFSLRKFAFSGQFPCLKRTNIQCTCMYYHVCLCG